MMARTRALRATAVVAGGLMLAATFGSGSVGAADDIRYGPDTVDIAAHWAARSTLANAVMFSGLGEPLSISMSTADDILKHAGYIARPPMPDMATVGTVYAAGSAALKQTPDFSKLQTLRWDPASFDRTLEPAAQAWALIKITGPAFHLNFHDDKADRRVALMMLPQARAQAKVLAERLLTHRGMFAARSPDGSFAEPHAGDQAVVLWGVSNLILAATSAREDYWHTAYRELVDADDYRDLSDRALAAVEQLPPETPGDRALALEALGRYAFATNDKRRREKALALARLNADALKQVRNVSLSDAALAVYGLVEAGRLLRDDRFAKAAAAAFETELLPKWDDRLGAFRTGEPVSYTPSTTAAVVAALNAIRWHGSGDLAKDANRIYPRFLQTLLVEAGLQLASPLPLVPARYREGRPDTAFAHPALPTPEKAGLAPVFAGEVVYEDGTWRVSDRRFRTAGAMLLANMLVMPHEGQADAFLPADRLKSLDR